MIAADVSVLTWSRMNTRSRRYSASVPMSTLLASHIVHARRLTPAEQRSRPRWTTCGTYASTEIAIPAREPAACGHGEDQRSFARGGTQALASLRRPQGETLDEPRKTDAASDTKVTMRRAVDQMGPWPDRPAQPAQGSSTQAPRRGTSCRLRQPPRSLDPS